MPSHLKNLPAHSAEAKTVLHLWQVWGPISVFQKFQVENQLCKKLCKKEK